MGRQISLLVIAFLACTRTSTLLSSGARSDAGIDATLSPEQADAALAVDVNDDVGTVDAVAAPEADLLTPLTADAASDIATAGDIAADVVTARLALDPKELQFAGTILGCTSLPGAVQVTNAGDGPTGPISVELAGDFAVTLDQCSGSALAPGATCNLTLAFKPVHIGASMATLAVEAQPGGVIEARLSGVGLGISESTVSPSAIDFATVQTGARSAPRSVTVTNFGSGMLAIASRLDGASAADFEIARDGCGGTAVAGGLSCQIEVVMAPRTRGDKQALLRIVGNGGTCGGGTAVVSLSGTALTF